MTGQVREVLTHVRKAMPKQEGISRNVVGWNPDAGKRFCSREIFIKVCLHNHLDLQFVHGTCERFIMYQLSIYVLPRIQTKEFLRRICSGKRSKSDLTENKLVFVLITIKVGSYD